MIEVNPYASNHSFPAYTFSGDNNTGVTSLSADTLALVGGGIARLHVASGSGNIGIGTTSPTATLHVSSSATTTNAIEITAPNQTTGNMLLINNTSASTGIRNMVHIKNTASQPGNMIPLRIENHTYSFGMVLTKPTNFGGWGDGLLIMSVDESQTTDILHLETNSTSKGSGNLRFLVRGDGNVGVGEASPGYSLHITAASASAESPSPTGSLNVDDVLFVTGSGASGLVGIGTATPATPLEIAGGNGNDSMTLLRLFNNDANANTEENQTAEIEFKLRGSEDSVISAKPAGRIVEA